MKAPTLHKDAGQRMSGAYGLVVSALQVWFAASSHSVVTEYLFSEYKP